MFMIILLIKNCLHCLIKIRMRCDPSKVKIISVGHMKTHCLGAKGTSLQYNVFLWPLGSLHHVKYL